MQRRKLGRPELSADVRREREADGERLANLRRSLRLTQADLAGWFGRSRVTASQWERGVLEVPAEVWTLIREVAAKRSGGVLS